jgi:CheY-like chemotaxis protein
MEQSMMNLAINAKDAMPEGGTMTIRTRNLTLDEEYCRRYPEVQPGDYVGLYVSDTGCGMANEVLDRIFDPFFTTKRPGEGTGLGLSIVFGIVKAHGGHVSCSSQPGTGTTFEIVLPAMETEVKADVDVTGEMPAFGTETVLLVDDEQLIRDMGKEILSQAGYTVLTASDGQAALDIYREQSDRIALVSLDMVKPRMGGTQCLEELLTIGPNVRVLVATGLLIDEQMRSFLAQRAKGFVKKPFRGSELLRAVRHVLESD